MLPFLAAFALVFGLYHLYAAVRLVQAGYTLRAGLVFVFGAVGVALAVGIWVARKRVRTQTAEASNDGGGRPTT
jgi:hypothetical protein